MKRDRKFELLKEAAESLSKLLEAYTDLALVFHEEHDKKNSELFMIDKSSKIIEEQLWISRLMIATLDAPLSLPSEEESIKPPTNMILSTKLLPMLSAHENCVISPYGISTILSMVAEGASESGLGDILSTLGFASLEELRHSLQQGMAESREAFQSENSISLMRGRAEAELLEAFKQTAIEQYSASIDENDSTGRASVVLQNAAKFKAQWLHGMTRDASHELRFHNADSSNSYPAFLSCIKNLRYYKSHKPSAIENSDVQAVALPYQFNGEKIPFELVLVDSEKPLTEGLVNKIFSNMDVGKCEVEFPEFSINSEFNLVPMMKALGLKIIFDSKNKAFDHITTVPLYAEKFKQIAEIQVDQEGTIASARTRMDCFQYASIPETVEMRFCRPFCYFLRNTVTGDILFMGRVNKLADCDRKATNDISDMLAFK